MSAGETFATVAQIISDTGDVSVEEIKGESDLIEDLGIDSLAFLDIAFEIDKTFGIQLPVEKWMEDVNQGQVSKDQYFVMDRLCSHIDGLVAAKADATDAQA